MKGFCVFLVLFLGACAEDSAVRAAIGAASERVQDVRGGINAARVKAPCRIDVEAFLMLSQAKQAAVTTLCE